jgi:hypothetical protein
VDGTITDEDRAWMNNYEAAMEPKDRERWVFQREYLTEQTVA